MAEEKLTSVKRFGTRYGRSLKLKFGKIEVEQRKKHKCPYCAMVAAKRVAVGIWQCKKCNAKFTGKAYTITQAGRIQVEEEKEKPSSVHNEEAEEEYAEEQQEEEQRA